MNDDTTLPPEARKLLANWLFRRQDGALSWTMVTEFESSVDQAIINKRIEPGYHYLQIPAYRNNEVDAPVTVLWRTPCEGDGLHVIANTLDMLMAYDEAVSND